MIRNPWCSGYITYKIHKVSIVGKITAINNADSCQLSVTVDNCRSSKTVIIGIIIIIDSDLLTPGILGTPIGDSDSGNCPTSNSEGSRGSLPAPAPDALYLIFIVRIQGI